MQTLQLLTSPKSKLRQPEFSERTVRQNAQRGTLGEEVLRRVGGTRLNTGAGLDALLALDDTAPNKKAPRQGITAAGPRLARALGLGGKNERANEKSDRPAQET